MLIKKNVIMVLVIGLSMGWWLVSVSAGDDEENWIFSEVLANPENEEKHEFLELLYEGTEQVDLTGWMVRDLSGEDELVDFVSDYDLGKEGLVLDKGDLLLVVDRQYDGVFSSELRDREEDLSKIVVITVDDDKIGNGLGNAADKFELIDEKGAVVTGWGWDKDAGNGISWENIGGEWVMSDEDMGNSFGWSKVRQKIDKGKDTNDGVDDEEWTRFWQDGEVPVRINELMVNPINEDDEWIELKSDWPKDIDLSNWYICDGFCDIESVEGGYKIDELVIRSNDYAVLDRERTKIALNNGGDDLYLFDPNHQWVDSVSYEVSIGEEVAYACDDGGWYLTNQATYGSENVIDGAVKTDNIAEKTDLDQPEDISDYIQIENLEGLKGVGVGTRVEFEGVVVVEYGLLEKNYMWVNDRTGGVGLYSKEDPGISSGLVLVRGEVRQLKYRQVVDIEKIDSLSMEKLVVREITTNQIDEFEDMVVEISGEVIDKGNSDLIVDDGSGQARVYFKEGANLSEISFKKGDKIRVKGLINEISSGYRLLPRYDEDILRIGGEEGGLLPSVGPCWVWIFKFFFIK
ncbi:lamin tail domain-containing protein [Patescibacteria group bacterium]|nr:lamin tail domain-containing protein [Patescibacteria group bacterium]